MKTKDFVIWTLLLLVIALLIAFYWSQSFTDLERKADKLAVTLSQVNKMLSADNQVVLQINGILDETGYPHLKRGEVENE